MVQARSEAAFASNNRPKGPAMAQIKIEVDRGCGWQVRQEGDADLTADDLAATLMALSIQYPHRAYLDGVLVAEAQRPHGARGKAKMVRHG